MKANRKKKLALSAAILALADKVMAWIIWLVIAIVVIVVGAIVVWKLIQTVRRLFPPDEPAGDGRANQITRVMSNGIFIYDDAPTSLQGLTSSTESGSSEASVSTVSNSTAFLPTVVSESTSSNSVAAPYTFTYMLKGLLLSNGVSVGPNAWVTSETNIGPVTFVDVKGSDLLNYSGSIVGDGVVIRISCSNGVVQSQMVVSNNMTTYRVELQRSSDLYNWTSISTNPACYLYTYQQCVDTNALPDRGFYRLKVGKDPN